MMFGRLANNITVHEDLPLLALMRLLSTFVAGHRLLDQELADNKSKKGKLWRLLLL